MGAVSGAESGHGDFSQGIGSKARASKNRAISAVGPLAEGAALKIFRRGSIAPGLKTQGKAGFQKGHYRISDLFLSRRTPMRVIGKINILYSLVNGFF